MMFTSRTSVNRFLMAVLLDLLAHSHHSIFRSQEEQGRFAVDTRTSH